MSPWVSVRTITAPRRSSARNVVRLGWPYRLPAPTLTTAIRGRIAANRSGEVYRLPWWGTLTTSEDRSTCAPSRLAWAASSTSPLSRIRPAGVAARSTSDALLISVPSASAVGISSFPVGDNTSIVRPGHDSWRPASSWTTGTPAAPAASRTSFHAQAGSLAGLTPTAPTSRSPRTASRPPMWSACRWLSTTSGTRDTPSRSRQPASGPGSGPVSTTTARPASPVASTSASPWPTSQATIAHPAGGQPGEITRIGTTTTSVPVSSAPTSTRSRRRRNAATTSSRHATSSSPPHQPSGQPMVAPGRPAAWRATRISQSASGPARRTSSSASHEDAGATSAATTPSTVAGATTGAASRFASTATRLTSPTMPATTGAVARCAAAGTATASASPRGTPRADRPRAQRGASSTSASVASTDSANPKLTAIAGSHRTSVITAAPSAGSAARWRPAASASSPTAPMTPARNTLGSAPASTTNPTSAPIAPSAAPRGPTRTAWSRNSTATHTIARFDPLTASRCAIPAASNSSATRWDSRSVSPTTRPGSSPAGSGSRTAVASRRPVRSDCATRCHQVASPSSSGGPRTRSTATVSSPERAGTSRAVAVTSWPGSSADQRSTGASSTTRPVEATGAPSTTASRTLAGTRTVRTPPR